MIIFFYLFVFLFFFCVSKQKFKSSINIISIFTFMWCFFGAISTFGFNGLRVPSDVIHFYALLFVVVTNLVILIRTRGIANNTIDVDMANPKIKTYAIYFQYIALLLYSPILFRSMGILIGTGSLEAVRIAYFGLGEYSKSDNGMFFALFAKIIPVGMFAGLNMYYGFMLIHAFSKKKLLWALVNLLIITLSNGGRTELMFFLISLVMSLCLKTRINKKSLANGRKVIFLIISLLVLVTVLRGSNIIMGTITYYSGSFSFLDYIIHNPTQFDLDKKLYGYLTFGAFIEPFMYLFKVLDLTTAKIPSYYFNIVCQEFYDIGNSTTVANFNNNTSVLYYYLRDFGPFGIILGGFFYGSLISFSKKCATSVNKYNGFFTLIYLFLCCSLVNTVMTYQLFAFAPFFSFITMYYCAKPINKKNINLNN